MKVKAKPKPKPESPDDMQPPAAAADTSAAVPDASPAPSEASSADPALLANAEPQAVEDLSPAGMIEKEMVRLYGANGLLPEPYQSGKIPREVSAMHGSKRHSKERFVYSVRFRSGPFGMVFDNRLPSSTVVERLTRWVLDRAHPRSICSYVTLRILLLVRGGQAEMSDIQTGDVLVYVEHINVTVSSPKNTQKLLGSLDWPMVMS